MAVRRIGVIGLAAAMVAVAACSAEGETADEVGDRNIKITAPQRSNSITAATKPTVPPGKTPSADSGSSPISVPRVNVPTGSNTELDVTLCLPTGISGTFQPDTPLLPGDSVSGLELTTNCDPAPSRGAARCAAPERLFQIDAPAAPEIMETILLGDPFVGRVDGQPAPTQQVRTRTAPFIPTSQMMSNRLTVPRLEYRVTARSSFAEAPPDEPALMDNQSHSRSPALGSRGDFMADDLLLTYEIRWAAQERTEAGGCDLFRRPPSPWSTTTLVDLNANIDDDPFVLVALGDSYGSGEGNPADPRRSPRDARFFFWGNTCNFGSTNIVVECPYSFDYSELGANMAVWGTANFCHRSSRSGVAKAVDRLREQWRFAPASPRSPGNFYFGHFACSGATSHEVVSRRYDSDFGAPLVEINPDRFRCQWTRPASVSSQCTSVEPQVDHATYWLDLHGLNPRDVDVVVVSIGGNDAGFADLVAKCFVVFPNTPWDCNDSTASNADIVAAALKASVLASLGVLPALASFVDFEPWTRSGAMRDLRDAMTRVAERVHDEYPVAEIMFTTYIDPVSVDPSSSADVDGDGVCSSEDLRSGSEFRDDWMWNVSPESARWLQGIIEEFGATIGDQAAVLRRQGLPVSVISDQTENHRNNGFCTGRDSRNVVFSQEATMKQGGDISDLLDLSSGGWHPNDLGYELYGEAIAEAINGSRNFLQTWPMRPQ